jgi:hypothetical protein
MLEIMLTRWKKIEVVKWIRVKVVKLIMELLDWWNSMDLVFWNGVIIRQKLWIWGQPWVVSLGSIKCWAWIGVDEVVELVLYIMLMILHV